MSFCVLMAVELVKLLLAVAVRLQCPPINLLLVEFLLQLQDKVGPLVMQQVQELPLERLQQLFLVAALVVLVEQRLLGAV